MGTNWAETAAETELGEALAAVTRANRHFIRDAFRAGRRFPLAALYMVIQDAAEYGKRWTSKAASVSTKATIAEVRQQLVAAQNQLADSARKLAQEEALSKELWAGLDVQQQSYDKGYAAGLAKHEQGAVK